MNSECRRTPLRVCKMHMPRKFKKIQNMCRAGDTKSPAKNNRSGQGRLTRYTKFRDRQNRLARNRKKILTRLRSGKITSRLWAGPVSGQQDHYRRSGKPKISKAEKARKQESGRSKDLKVKRQNSKNDI